MGRVLNKVSDFIGWVRHRRYMWVAEREARRRRRLVERVQRDLREHVDLQFDIGDEIVEAVVERRRPKVVEVLARTDPFHSERALTFSQEGEDLILARMLAGRPPGFFVDVGAYHPFRFSNTYLLYRAGWRGINVDATPGSMRLFKEFRPEDINIECFVGNPDVERTLTMYNEPALNTASESVLGERVLPELAYRRVGEAKVPPRSLSKIIDEHLPPGTPIDFFNIDVEGSEQEVLASNAWDLYRPDIILIEQLVTNLQSSLDHPTTRFLCGLGYELVGKAYNTAFFALKEIKPGDAWRSGSDVGLAAGAPADAKPVGLLPLPLPSLHGYDPSHRDCRGRSQVKVDRSL